MNFSFETLSYYRYYTFIHASKSIPIRAFTLLDPTCAPLPVPPVPIHYCSQNALPHMLHEIDVATPCCTPCNKP